MTNTKRTRKDNFEDLKELALQANRTDLVEFVEHQIEMDNKKKESKGETAKQKENVKIKDIMLTKFEELGEKMVTVTELLQDSEINELVGGSNQKATALLTALKKDNKIVNVKEGKKSYYKIA